MAGTTIKIPFRGTAMEPELDQIEALSAKVLAERDIKEGIAALQDRLRQLQMKLSDCIELYLKRRRQRVIKLREARTARACLSVMVCSAIMIVVSYIIRWLRGSDDPCT